MLGPLDQSGKPKIIHYIFARAIVGSSAMVCVYQAYARFPIGDTGAITNSNVVWTSLIGMNFKNHKLLQNQSRTALLKFCNQRSAGAFNLGRSVGNVLADPWSQHAF